MNNCNKNLAMYIVINKDLPMSIGKTAVQASHACTEYLMHVLFGNNENEISKVKNWYQDCQKKIILGAHENKMKELSLIENVFPIYNLGLTEIAPNSLTAVCLGIFDKSEIPKDYTRLQLL